MRDRVDLMVRGIPNAARRALLAAVAAGAVAALVPLAVRAHVKWFSEYNYEHHISAERLSENGVLWVLLIIAAASVWLLRIVETSALGYEAAYHLGALQRRLASFRRRALVCTAIFYFAANATIGNVILTPELVIDSTGVRWLHALAAIALVIRRAEPFAGVVLLVLFGIALSEYGPMHMLDYLLFLGVAFYFLLPNLPVRERVRILRIAAAASFMWVSVEKWVFPEWVMQIVREHPSITFGFPQQQFITLSGVVEFTLGFGLLWRGFYSVCSAVVFMFLLSAAILEFGYVDLAGHILVLGVLLVLALERVRPLARAPYTPPWTVAASFLGSSVAVIAIYHAMCSLHS